MRTALVLLLVCPAIWADSITPTITQNLVEIGNVGPTYVSSSYVATPFEINASIGGTADTFPGPPNGGGQAEADITMEAAFLVAGTGTGYIHYSSSGGGDGSGGSYSASFQLNDLNENCFFDCNSSGSDAFQLGLPFLLKESGTAFAFSGPNFEGAGYNVSLDFTVTDAAGHSLAITEVPLPTPEPRSLLLLVLGSFAIFVAAGLRTCRR